MSTRNRVLRAAALLFAEHGYASVSMREIAEQVGVKREALYHHFPNKAQILSEMLMPSSVDLLDDFKNRLASNERFVVKLSDSIEAHLAHFDPNFLELAVAIRDLSLLEANPRLNQIRQIWKAYEQLWVKLIEEGQRSGSVDPTLSPRTVAFGILGMLNSLSNWFDKDSTVSLEEITQTWTKLILNGAIVHTTEKDTGANKFQVN